MWHPKRCGQPKYARDFEVGEYFSCGPGAREPVYCVVGKTSSGARFSYLSDHEIRYPKILPDSHSIYSEYYPVLEITWGP